MIDVKILIIEDEKFDRAIIEECLTEKGYTDLIFAESGEKGLEKIKEENPAIAVVDTHLPGIDGFETCKRIKKLNDKIKVIVLTGNARHVDFPRSRSIGLDEYTVKTANCGELIACLQRCIASLNKNDS